MRNEDPSISILAVNYGHYELRLLQEMFEKSRNHGITPILDRISNYSAVGIRYSRYGNV